MASRIRRPLLLLLLAHMALTSGQIRLFINQLPEYSALAPCTEVPVSTVVRITSDGCGDGSQTISYHYFCRTSSSYFSSLIGSKVDAARATELQTSRGLPRWGCSALISTS
jgi:hypothetical protein